MIKIENQDVVKLLNRVGSTVKSDTGYKIIAQCPFQHLHSGGMDKNPSFAFMKTSSGNWRYNCFACGSKGGLRRFLWKMHFEKRIRGMYGLFSLEQLRLDIKAEEKASKLKGLDRYDYAVGGKYAPSVGRATPQPRFAPYNVHKSTSDRLGDQTRVNTAPTLEKTVQGQFEGFEGMPIIDNEPVAKPSVDQMTKWKNAPIPRDYLRSRRLSIYTYEHFGMGNDEKTRRMIFPVYDRDGELVAYSSRLYWDKEHCYRCGHVIKDEKVCPQCREKYAKYIHFSGKWRRNHLFGLDKVIDGQPIIVVEGPMDVLWLHQCGFHNAVCIFGASPNIGQMQSIAKLTEHVLVIGDGDEAGWRMNQETCAMLDGLGVETLAIDLPSGDCMDYSGDEIRDMIAQGIEKLNDEEHTA